MSPKKKRKSRARTTSVRKRRAKIRSPHSADRVLRNHLLKLLDGGSAHVAFDKAVAGLPPVLRGVRSPGAPYTPWQLLEHLRIAQWDILQFSVNPKHVSPEWPAGYWPSADAPPDDAAWERSLRLYRADHEAMKKLVGNPKTNLFARIPHGTGQTILREALLQADHEAYHVGQIVLLRRLLGDWSES